MQCGRCEQCVLFSLFISTYYAQAVIAYDVSLIIETKFLMIRSYDSIDCKPMIMCFTRGFSISSRLAMFRDKKTNAGCEENKGSALNVGKRKEE